MNTTTLSEAALSLLQRRLSEEWVPVTKQTRPLYRELVEAGLMIPLHSFARGDEGAYLRTKAGCDFMSRKPSVSPWLAQES